MIKIESLARMNACTEILVGGGALFRKIQLHMYGAVFNLSLGYTHVGNPKTHLALRIPS